MSVTLQAPSLNFSFLAEDDQQLVRLGGLAERYFKEDPNTCLIKLRQYGEILAQLVAANFGLYHDPREPQLDLLRRLGFERVFPREVADLFHHLRKIGNTATHAGQGTHDDALAALKVARELGVWYHRTFGTRESFSPEPFVPPPDPAAATQELRDELARLRTDVDSQRAAAENARSAAEEHQRARLSAEELARQALEDSTTWERIAVETEQAKAAVEAELQRIQTAAVLAPAPTTLYLLARSEAAATEINLDEATTRALVDEQLRARGWEADTKTIRYASGARPSKGRNVAIAEWPTESGHADYALFVGTQCIGVVEAKRRNKNVSSHIDQAERYARGFRFPGGAEPIGGPWPDGKKQFLVPFVFSANGRRYLKQLETQSGIWFRDARRPANHRRALVDWPSPDGLEGMLEIDVDRATADLEGRAFDFAFPLRPYQKAAIATVESRLAEGQRNMLLAMATGTGKTKVSIALLYRLLAAKRFRRVCFVVDRNALGKQAAGEFETTRIVTTKTFADIFGLKDLKSITPDPETKVHICTIQGLVMRVLYAESESATPPVDQYDLIVVDECHRGYLLDRELSDAELGFRNEDDYISKYRRVLEHFDAVKIGLTATPALHTVSIFGEPVFTYSYREAVVEGYLVDHEPPVEITTALSAAGIKFGKGEEVEVLNPRTGAVDLAHMPDEIEFKVDEFNRAVVTVAFNRVVATELARHIDPSLPGKTLVFAVNNDHADLVVEQLKEAFAGRYGDIEDAAIQKITGSVDDPGGKILSFRNDALPKIAVTVDLLTTGIDVPKIENLVFLRRVNSRILYEQMLGRATRLCPEIGKEAFRIFDAVDLYPHLQDLTDMKPVVVNPKITLTQLFEELARVVDASQQESVRDQLLVALRRRMSRFPDQVRAAYELDAHESPESTLERLRDEPLHQMVTWIRDHPNLGQILDWDPETSGPRAIPISHHPDRVISVGRGYGDGRKPEDFLESFTSFVKDNVNQIAALTVVLQRPRELTRAELKTLRLALDARGFSEANLRRAWTDARNEDMAASIIGYVRQAALGDPLTPFDARVRAAMHKILARQVWTDVQRKWLKRIEDQLIREIVVDRAAIDEEPFRADGGFQRLNKVFEGNLEVLLRDINEELWKKSA